MVKSTEYLFKKYYFIEVVYHSQRLSFASVGSHDMLNRIFVSNPNYNKKEIYSGNPDVLKPIGIRPFQESVYPLVQI